VAESGLRDTHKIRLGPIYSCEEMCGRTALSPGDLAKRAACRCSLVDFGPEAWDRDADPGAAFEAEWRAEEINALALSQRIKLDFDLDRDGCPWGWAQSRFALYVASFMGSRTSTSTTRTPSLRMTRRMIRDDEEPLELYEWARLAEAWEDGSYSLYHERLNRRE